MDYHSTPSYRRSRIAASALVVVLLVLVVALPALASGNWTVISNLVDERAEHEAVRLNDGRVLLVGGRLWSPAALTAEIYDPDTGTWSATGPKNFASVGSSVTLLADGRVLVAGANGGYFDPSPFAEIYDPATDTWTQTGSMTRGRAGHLAVRLNDGRVLVAGSEWPSPSAELYDPATGTWSATGSPNTWHGDGTISLLPDGRVLVAGGLYLDSVLGEITIAAAEIYDPATGVWQLTDSLNTARKRHTATQLADGRILVVAGQDSGNFWLASAEIYNPATGNWSFTGSLNETRVGHTATLLADGQVLVAGNPSIVPGHNPRSAELYDPATGAWSSLPDMPIDRVDHTATLLANGDVLLAGGLPFATMETAVLYTPGEGIPPTPAPTPTNTLHVGDLDGSSFPVNQRFWGASVTILVQDTDGNPVADANVSGSWSGGISGNVACTTGGSGTCTVTSSNVRKNKNSVVFTVSNVGHATLVYNPEANSDPDGDSNGTTITVSRP